MHHFVLLYLFKDDSGKYSLGSRGYLTQWAIKWYMGILNLSWLLLLPHGRIHIIWSVQP
jgi:uncharacterized membrane protein SpoIIM required for sporulation